MLGGKKNLNGALANVKMATYWISATPRSWSKAGLNCCWDD